MQIWANIQSVVNRAHMDPLTRALNRAGLSVAFEEHRTEQDVFALMVDIDHFKQVNDTYGHAIGDVVLQGVADILRKNLRYGDVLARWGGEEFVCLIRGTSAKAALMVAERMRKAVAAGRYPAAPDVRVTASFGLTMMGEDDVLEALVERADTALYDSKNKGRDCVCIV